MGKEAKKLMALQQQNARDRSGRKNNKRSVRHKIIASGRARSRELAGSPMKRKKAILNLGKRAFRDGANGASQRNVAAAKPKWQLAFRQPKTELEQAIQRYIDLFDFAPMGYVTFDRLGRIEEINIAASRLLGRSRKHLIGITFAVCIAREDMRLFMDHLMRCHSSDGSAVTELSLKRTNGEKIPVLLSTTGTVGLMKDGTRLYHTAIVDLTERKRAERVAMRLAAVVQSSHDAIVTKDTNGIITHWNQSAERIFGYKPKEIIGKSVLTLIPKDRQSEEQEIMRTISRGESLDHYETVRRRKDGKLIDVSLTISPIKDAKGAIVGVSKIARDITERKQTERRLAEQARLLDLTNDAVIVRDHQDRIVYWNRGAKEMYGFSAKEALGKGTHELLQTRHPENCKDIQKTLDRDGRWSGELVHTRKGGKTISVYSRWSLDRDARGRPASILETNTDVTARKRAEYQQRALNQFAQVQNIAANVAEIYDAALDAIVVGLGCHRASILLFDRENVMRFVAWRGLSERYRNAVEGHSPWKPDAKSADPICINDVDVADIPKPLKSTIRREGILATAFIPLVTSRKLIGKFMTYYNEPHVFTAEELNLATTIATQLAQGIEHKRDEEELRQSQKQLARELEDVRLLQQTSAYLIHQDDAQALYEKILDAAISIMRSDFGSFQILYPEGRNGGKLRLLAYRGYTRESAAAWEWIRADQSTTCGTALRRGRRSIVADVETCDWMAGTKDLAFYRQTGVRSMQSTPLISRTGRTLGMISTGWKQVHEPSERDLRLLDVLARQAADVIERRQAQSALQQKEAELEQIVTQTPFMLTRCTRDLRYRYVSRAYAEMFGRTPEELAGKSIVKIIGKEALKTILPYIRKVLKGEEARYEMEVPFQGVGTHWINSAYVPDRDSNGNVVGWFASLVDVGVAKKAEAMLQKSKELLEGSVRERTRELDLANKELQAEIQRRKGLEGEILSVSDREQQRLGQELHDGLCQHLTAVAFMTRSIALRLKDHRVVDAADIEKVAELVNQAAVDTRNLSRALHRVDVDAAGLIVALQDLADREIWRTPCRLEVKPSFQISVDAHAAHLYRIAREAVINANKHAHAREIVVRLERVRKEMVLRVIDDGIGFPKDLKPQQGLGYHIMNYRAQLMGGRLEIDSPKTGGTRVSCFLPRPASPSGKGPNNDKPPDRAPGIPSLPTLTI
jgi:PAS domain S-box-containing protein